MIKLTCLSFIYLNVCNRVCNNVYSHAICSTLRALFLFSVVLFRVRNCLLLLLKNEDVQIYQDDCPEIYFIKYKLIDMNIHSSVKVIPCTIYLNLSKDTIFGSSGTTNKNGDRRFVWELRYFEMVNKKSHQQRIFIIIPLAKSS